jgi:hypothetical protein
MIRTNNFKNRLNSFILLPLLLTNIATPGLINKPLIPDPVEGVFSLNFQILKSDLSNTETTTSSVDPRAEKIDAYFAQWDLPLAGYGAEMVAVSDKYDIDWTILPALAMLETTGGKNLCDNVRKGIRNHNAFGYGGCSIYFATFEDAFESVAKTISGNGKNTSHLYSGKSIEEILEVYNPPGTPGMTVGYHKKAIKVMSDIDGMQVDTDVLAQA